MEQMDAKEISGSIVDLLNSFEGCNCDYQELLEDVIAECESRLAGIESDKLNT